MLCPNYSRNTLLAIIKLQSYVYAVDASQWSMGSVYVCFGASSKRKTFKISSIICVSFCIFCVDLVGRCVEKQYWSPDSYEAGA